MKIGDTHTQIKLCGLRRPEDIQIVNEVLPEYAGFILAEGRRRTVSPQQMAELSARLRPGIRKVAVFLNQDPEWICHLAKQGLMDLIQLHGAETEDEIRLLQQKTGKPVVKAFNIETEDDIRMAQESPADLVLLDWDKLGYSIDFNQPTLPPTGIRSVWVNGVPALEEGVLTRALTGRVITRNAD